MSSRVGKFHDGIDYRFFNNRDAPEMPAEVYLDKRASPFERSVRQKLMSQSGPPTSTPIGMDTATDTQGDQGEEGEAKDIDWESDAESVDAQVPNLDMTMPLGQGSESRSAAVSARAEGEGADSAVSVDSSVSPITTKAAAQTEPGGDGGGSGGDKTGQGSEGTSKSGDGHDHSDGGRTSPTVLSSSSPSTPSDRLSELVGWSELLMVDVVLAYFRYYAHRRKGYVGRTFCHRSQVLVPGLCLFLVYTGDECTPNATMPSA